MDQSKDMRIDVPHGKVKSSSKVTADQIEKSIGFLYQRFLVMRQKRTHEQMNDEV